jgi:uridine phosphorylase
MKSKMQEYNDENEWSEQMCEIAKDWLFPDVPLGQFPKSLILPLENPDLYDHSSFTSKIKNVKHYKSISIGTYNEQPIGVMKSKFGAPAVAMAVHVLSTMGTENIVGVGYCGGLQSNISCGDLILPIACVRDEGTSVRYVSEAYPAVADVESYSNLQNIVHTTGFPHHSGLVWSTDTILLETSVLVQKWSKHDVIGVDMESSALFTVARLFGIKATSILVASDNPLTGSKTIFKELSTGTAKAMNVSFKLATI